MATEHEFINTIDLLNSNNENITFAELVAKVWKNRIVEIYIGDTFEDIKFDDSTQKYPAILVGRVVAAYAECIILNCAYMDQSTKKVRFGNIVCLNERAIRTITEVDESGILRDTFLNSRDGKIVKDALRNER
jgi:hypothetical protein